MQSSHEEDKKKSAAEQQHTEPELSDAWRALLGLQTGEKELEDGQSLDPAAQVPPLASDPWSSLLNAQGMQPVDLQKVHLHNLHAALQDNNDIEHALNIIREATGQLPALNEKSRDT